ncbi:MAG: GNAT family N-acetyltransferase [Verrucomicrobia bacterium]|nr:GNAT family N-acetyltransferase [Verrucomicrobiota bacterium]
MPISIKPICDFLDSADLLKRVPKELLPLAKNRLPWTGYLVFTGDETLVGMCAFKAEPSEQKDVEIAYFTFPEYERKGYATDMARLLVSLAKESDETEIVFANTLRTENASARICRRLGFEFKGGVMDPEDGLVWHWRKSVGR